MRGRYLISIVLLLLIPAVAACGATSAPAAGETPTSGAQPTAASVGGGEAQVTMINTAFEPAQITVQAGTTVTWTNEDPVPHTVTAGTRDNPSGLFESGNIEQGGTFSFTFDEPGTYPYFCSIHPGMDGTVIVQ